MTLNWNDANAQYTASALQLLLQNRDPTQLSYNTSVILIASGYKELSNPEEDFEIAKTKIDEIFSDSSFGVNNVEHWRNFSAHIGKIIQTINWLDAT